MKNYTAIGVALVIILGAGYFVVNNTGNIRETNVVSSKTGEENKVGGGGVEGGENSVIQDGVQYVTIVASGGYAPRQSYAKAGLPTKLIVKTNGTYDCSAALVIKSLKYREMLPRTGETSIDVGTPVSGETLQGVCAMGMYSFVVTFK